MSNEKIDSLFDKNIKDYKNIEKKSNRPVRVTSNVVFSKIYKVDTKAEKYEAEIYIEAYWEDIDIFNALANTKMSKNGINKYLDYFYI